MARGLLTFKSKDLPQLTNEEPLKPCAAATLPTKAAEDMSRRPCFKHEELAWPQATGIRECKPDKTQLDASPCVR